MSLSVLPRRHGPPRSPAAGSFFVREGAAFGDVLAYLAFFTGSIFSQR